MEEEGSLIVADQRKDRYYPGEQVHRVQAGPVQQRPHSHNQVEDGNGQKHGDDLFVMGDADCLGLRRSQRSVGSLFAQKHPTEQVAITSTPFLLKTPGRLHFRHELPDNPRAEAVDVLTRLALNT